MRNILRYLKDFPAALPSSLCASGSLAAAIVVGWDCWKKGESVTLLWCFSSALWCISYLTQQSTLAMQEAHITWLRELCDSKQGIVRLHAQMLDAILKDGPGHAGAPNDLVPGAASAARD